MGAVLGAVSDWSDVDRLHHARALVPIARNGKIANEGLWPLPWTCEVNTIRV